MKILRRLLLFILVMSLGLVVIGCGKNPVLSGRYSNEDGSFVIDFVSDYEVEFYDYEEGYRYSGTYRWKKNTENFYLEYGEIGIDTSFATPVHFSADVVDEGLIITGGAHAGDNTDRFNHVLFTRE